MPITNTAVPNHPGGRHASSAPTPVSRVENAFHSSSSFDQKAASGGQPAMARHDTRKVQWVVGMYLRRPPMRRMSCTTSSPCSRACMAWITEPAHRNRQPLKKACVSTWKKPAPKAPTPTPMNMKPSWLTVE